MHIIELTQTQYKNYSNIHSKRNFGQTIEFSMLKNNVNKKRLFLGLVDNFNNLQAATLILITNVSPSVKEAIAPNGFLIDYANFSLVKTFTEELKKYLLKEKVTYLITNPMYKHKIYNKQNQLIENNESIINNLYTLGYKNIGYTSDFEKYDIIIENNNSVNDIYKNFNRNTKRNINEGLKYGITLHKGTSKDLEDAYNIFKKKSHESLSYYQNLMSIYNSKDNKMEIFLAKLNPHTYLVNSKKLYEKEKLKNEKIHNSINKNIGHIKEKLLNKKINSDNTLEKYSQNLNRALKINSQYSDSIIIGTSIIIKNNHEIYFLIDGYKEEYRQIHSTHILKWGIIKKYYSLGYRIFNLGEIHKDYQNKSNKYHSQYMYKIGFGGNIIEYPPNLLLVINKPIYNAYTKLKSFKLIKK